MPANGVTNDQCCFCFPSLSALASTYRIAPSISSSESRHTFHSPPAHIRGGRFPSNWELSTSRAQEVVNYLIRQGVSPQRLAAVGMGEYHPIDPADNLEAYRRNRRIELKITSR